RRRISYELQDHFGQQLTALMMGLETLSKLPATTAGEHVTKLQGIAADLMQKMNYLAWDLRPAALDTLGLEATLRQFVSEWSQITGIQADFIANHFNNERRLPPHLENTFYRVVQESLTNVQRHARANYVSVILEYNEVQATVIVEDDGHGFDPEEIYPVAGA